MSFGRLSGLKRGAYCLRGVASAAVLLAPPLAHAENTIAFWGNYYLERSTRVISPMVALDVDLPKKTHVNLVYLVDNITSASGNIAGALDAAAFQEYRQEVRLGLDKELFGFLRPGITARYSFEPDYTSLTYGASLTAELFDANTTVTMSGQRQNDAISARGREIPEREDTLDTWRWALSFTQLISPVFIAGGSVELQFLDGYTENPYRLGENHPRSRSRHAVGAWLAYRFRGTRTSLRPSYRYYWDDWQIRAHTFELQVFQEITRDIELVPHIRLHTQTGVDFRRQIEEQGTTFQTQDPKLMALGTTGLGLRVVWTLSLLDGTIFDTFQTASLHARYMFFAQRNALELNPVRLVSPREEDETLFGDAHVAQLGVSWPF